MPTETHASWHAYAGFVSGVTSSVLLQPLDLLKTRIQQNRQSTLRSSLLELRGVSDAWRGTVPSVLRTSIGGSLYFSSLNVIRTYLAQASGSNGENNRPSSSLPQLSRKLNLLSGAIARGSIGFLTMPVTVVKVRFESSGYQNHTVWKTIAQIYKESGYRGFFKGYGVTASRDAPYAGLYVLFYEQNKETIGKAFNSSHYGFAVNWISAALAAATATTITGPFDTVKTRIQLDPIGYKTFSKTAYRIVSEEGFLKLFDGLSLRLTRKALSSGIGWMIYEEIVNRGLKEGKMI